MTRRSQSEWQTLIKQQQDSGLSAAEFCRQHDINQKYFSARKQQLAKPESDFIQVTPHASHNQVETTVSLRVMKTRVPLSSLSSLVRDLLLSEDQ